MAGELIRTDQNQLQGRGGLVEALAQLPEEEVWLADLRSEQTKRTCRLDVRHVIETLGIRSVEELRRTAPRCPSPKASRTGHASRLDVGRS